MTPLDLVPSPYRAMAKLALLAAVLAGLAGAVLYHKIVVGNLRSEVRAVTAERDLYQGRNQELARINGGWSRAALAQAAQLEASVAAARSAERRANDLARSVASHRQAARSAAAAAGYSPAELTAWFRSYLAP